jgi:hypothetical protein
MMSNIAIDSLLGAIPVVGDIFDVAYKANVKNVAIFREAIRGDRRARRDWAFVIVVISVLILLIALPLLVFLYFVRLLTLT